MHKHLILSFCMSILMISCSGNQVIIDDFESGNYGKWSVEGNAFQSSPMHVTADSGISGNEGNFLAAGIDGPGTFGTMTSKTFLIERNYLNFLIGGVPSSFGNSPVAFELLVDGQPVRKACPRFDDARKMEWRSWDVREFSGKNASVRIKVDSVPSHLSSMGKSILIDCIALSDTKKGTFNDYLSIHVKASRKYLLIPSSNNGEVSRLSIMADGRNILGVPQDFTLASGSSDYDIPVDISAYKGRELDIVVTSVDDRDLSVTGIKQSDEKGIAYDEPYRPVYHFTPDFGWTNDPNGMVYLDGEYHLAYQANPYGTKHYNMHWGNAVSTDLVHWKDLPFIVAPDELGAIYSGSSVVDVDNTAGFGRNAIVAMYTSASNTQKQSIAYSIDKGRTYTKYKGNPVLFEADKQPDFRDPKLMRYNNKWIVSVAAGEVISFYESPDLKNWTKLSDFGKGIGSHAAVWECPDLMKFEYNGREKWVLIVNINPGGPNGGSVAQYFIGSFNGKEFVADDLPYPLWVDEGMDDYAGVTFSNTGDRHIFLGWMSNWLYSNDVPTINFRNGMTIPRDLSLKSNGSHLFLASTPSEEIYAARDEKKSIAVPRLSGEFIVPKILAKNNGAYEIDFEITPGSDRNLVFSLCNAKGEEMKYTFDFNDLTLVLDRSKSGLTDFHEGFAKSDILTHLVRRQSYQVKLFVDRNSTELFMNDGDLTFTNCMFPTEVYDSIKFLSSDAVVSNLSIYELK
jgi:fructan beta-fructosidase